MLMAPSAKLIKGVFQGQTTNWITMYTSCQGSKQGPSGQGSRSFAKRCYQTKKLNYFQTLQSVMRLICLSCFSCAAVFNIPLCFQLLFSATCSHLVPSAKRPRQPSLQKAARAESLWRRSWGWPAAVHAKWTKCHTTRSPVESGRTETANFWRMNQKPLAILLVQHEWEIAGSTNSSTSRLSCKHRRSPWWYAAHSPNKSRHSIPAQRTCHLDGYSTWMAAKPQDCSGMNPKTTKEIERRHEDCRATWRDTRLHSVGRRTKKPEKHKKETYT